MMERDGGMGDVGKREKEGEKKKERKRKKEKERDLWTKRGEEEKKKTLRCK